MMYAGGWSGDKKQGRGRLYDSEEQCYFEGFFKMDYRDGDAIEIQKDGRIKESVWRKGERIG